MIKMIKTKSVQATMMLPARFFLLYSSYLLFILQPRSESCAWQWGGEVIVLVVILIQEIHLLHAEEWQTLWEEADKIGYTF